MKTLNHFDEQLIYKYRGNLNEKTFCSIDFDGNYKVT